MYDMKKTRFSETQIVKALKEHEAGRKQEDICRELEISKATFYNWKSKYGGMDVSDVKRLKELEEENARLKRMYANLSLDHEILKDIITKKRLGPCQQRELAEEAVKDYRVSVSRACRIARLPKSQYYYRSRKDDAALITALQDHAQQYPSYGFRKLFAYLRRAGHRWNHKRVYRVYRLLKLNKRRGGKRRLPTRTKQPLQQRTAINQSWSMDFMSDSLVNGRKFRTLNVMDDYSREALAIEVDTSISAKRVIRVLEQLINWRGKPQYIRVDNGPEFTSKAFELWALEQQICIQYIQPGRPMQNGFIERFNGSYRKEVLDAYVFFGLDDVREITEQWVQHYNDYRPHEALNNLTPNEWKQKIELSNLELSE